MNRGNVDSSGDREVTTRGVYVANKRNVANLTHMYISDNGVFSPNLLTAGLAQSLLPTVPAVNDIVYFGIDTSVTDSGPFNSLIFDVATPAIYPTTAAIIWEYWDGGSWTTLTVYDRTSTITGGTDSWDIGGNGTISWATPSDWATTTKNSVTAYWMRARVTNIGTGITAPTQQNRHVYSVVWPYIEIQESEIGGSIDALLKNDIDIQYASRTTIGRTFVGTRGVGRGSLFTPVINMAQSQNPNGITPAANAGRGSFVTDVDGSPVGEVFRTNAFGTFRQTAKITLDSSIASHYYGKFRAFMRYNVPIMTGDVEIFIGLRYQAGSDGNVIINTARLTHGSLSVPVLNKITDLGIVNILPEAQLWQIDELEFQIWSSSQETIDMIDFWLMPVDERTVENRLLNSTRFASGALISDNISMPKRFIGYAYGDGAFITSSSVINGGLSTIKSGANIRVYVLGMSTPDSNGDLTSRWDDLFAINMSATQRYLSMRGDK